MAGTVSAGTIVYEVDMDTARLLQGRRDIDDALNGLNGSMGRLEAGLNRTERSLSSIGGTMSSLTGVAKALSSRLAHMLRHGRTSAINWQTPSGIPYLLLRP